VFILAIEWLLEILNLEGLTGITSPHYEPLSTFIVKDDKFYKNTFFEWKDPIIQKIYEYLSNGDIGDEVGEFKNGKPVFKSTYLKNK